MEYMGYGRCSTILILELMPTDYVNILIKLAEVRNPVESPKANDWNKIEADFGFSFPQDYKDLVTSFGSGEFGVGLCFRSPIDASEYNILSPEAVVRHFEPVIDMKEDAKLQLYPDPFGAVVIGTIDRQDFLLRPDKTGKKLVDLVWWDIDTGEVKELEMSISRFVHDLYCGKLHEAWAIELRDYIWRNGTAPLFTQRDG